MFIQPRDRVNSRRVTRCLAALTSFGATLTLAATTGAADMRPAPFPDKAAAILVQGDTEVRFKNDVNDLTTVLSGNRWKYGTNGGSVRKLLMDGTAGATTWTNVGKAFQGAGADMWAAPASQQHLVYYHSSHGGNISDKNSTMSFGDVGKDAKDFVKMIQDHLPQGHKEFSKDGTTNTTCVQSMTFMLQPCRSGGQIYELTTTLADKEVRRKYFPALSDISVLTAADSNEDSYSCAAPPGVSPPNNTWSVPLTNGLKTNFAMSAWDVYKNAAENDVSNDNKAYTPNSDFGAGNNRTQYVPGKVPDGSGQYEHPLYRHVSFYPSITFGAGSADGNVSWGSADGHTTLDFGLSGPSDRSLIPKSGPVPVRLSNVELLTTGQLNLDRDMWPLEPMRSALDPSLSFVQYYTFNMLGGGEFGSTGSLEIDFERDDVETLANVMNSLKLFQWRSGAWHDTLANLDYDNNRFSVGLSPSIAAFGTFALVIPQPGAFTLLILGGLLAASRRRSTRA